MPRRAFRRREDRHHPHVPGAALRAYEMPVLGHVLLGAEPFIKQAR
jgi:hypothetical protein